MLNVDTTILLLGGTQSDSLNISHKILTWHLLGKPGDNTIKGFTNNEILDAYKSMDSFQKSDFISSMFARTGREEFLLERFSSEDRKIFLGDMVSDLFNSSDKLISSYKGILKFLDNDLYGKDFGESLYANIKEGGNDYIKDLTLLVIMSDDFRNIVFNDNVFNLDIEKIKNIEIQIDKANNFDINEALKDGEWRSVTMFVWDPEHTGDNKTNDKRMQLSDFNSTLKLDLANGYNISGIKGDNGKNINLSGIDLSTNKGQKLFYDKYISNNRVKSISLERTVNGIKDIHELLLSNNNSKNDFKSYVEEKNKGGGSKYDQIDIRGHCWSNEEALGHDKDGNFDRSSHLLLINGGCYQEENTEEYSEKLNNKAFQVATTQTGLGEQMTSRLSIQYRTLILEDYTKQQAIVLKQYKVENSGYKGNFSGLPYDIQSGISLDMKAIDEQIRNQKYFKNIVSKNIDAKGVALTTESMSRLLSRVDSDLLENI